MEKEGLVKRLYTQKSTDPLEVTYEKRDVRIVSEKGDVIFERKGIEVPSSWSQLATQILAEKYVMKKGVPTPTGEEIGARQVVHRISNTIRRYGEERGYFSSEEADTFEAELSYMLINQIGSFNSPVLFNVGHYHQYGIRGDGKSAFYWNPAKDKIEKVSSTYEHPQCSACFIISLEDSLESMMDLQKTEVMLFKGGSGTGTNFSKIRGTGEHLSSGGKSSGLMSFLKGYDAWAGVIKSGGTTRRAAKMVILNADHPEIEAFITCKANEERIVKEHSSGESSGHFEAGAYKNAWWQNANNSVRVTDEFMGAVLGNKKWQTYDRTTGKVFKEYNAQDLWSLICKSAWECGDPGLQFDTTINKWHTAKASSRINASNPCSEYMFLDDSACNLASLNLIKFLKEDGSFDADKFQHACDVFILAQEILVDMSSYPTEKIAQNSHGFRALGLGYSNLGSLLMTKALPYDSEEGRSLAAAITAIMSGSAYAQSSRIAAKMGAFAEYEKNKGSMLEVLQMHRSAVDKLQAPGLENLIIAARSAFDTALELGKKHGYRNAQTTLLAPTGTISFLMDCDTTGIEPDYSLLKQKKLAGGGEVSIANKTVPIALAVMGYDKKQTDDILAYINAKGHVEGAPHLKEEHYAVFDCASIAPGGKRFIVPIGHVKMLAAVQPFLSGAISKTVNLPTNATVEDISKIYVDAWKLGLKAIALYRDGCKFSQPLQAAVKENKEKKLESKLWGYRKRLEPIREGITVGATISGHSLIMRTGEYPDGNVGEIFVDMFEDGTEFKSALHSWAVSSSIGLQHGWPLEHFVMKFLYAKSSPSGLVTDHPYIKMCDSVYQFVARVLAVEYLCKTEYANIPPDQSKLRANVLKAISELKAKESGIVSDKTVKKAEEKIDSGLEDKIIGELCQQCGSLMVRSGTCYVCRNCATTSGCS